MLGLRYQARKLHQLMLPESGQSLVLALIIMSALSISITAVISFTTGNETSFDRDLQVQRAFAVAEAGLNNGIAVISNQDASNTVAVGTRLPSVGNYSVTLDGVTGSYYMKKFATTSNECNAQSTATTPCWIVYGTAKSPNNKISKAVQETVSWRTSATDDSQVFTYGLVVDNAGGSCVDTHGTTALTIKDVWISGDFCPAGNIGLVPPAGHVGSVYIGGQYQGRNNTGIGASGTPYHTTDIVGGCTKQGKAEICSDSANSNVYSDGTPTGNPSTLSLPDILATANYNSAPWNYWGQHCASGSFTFDSDATQNGTTPTTTLFGWGSDFNCTVHATTDPASTAIGHIQWNHTTKQLSISGVIWIDGNASMSDSGTYVADTVVPTPSGKEPGGTIFVNGTISGSSNIAVCGPVGTLTATGYGCPGTWDPTQGSLGLVVINPSNATTGFDRTGNGELDMTILVNQGYADTGGTVVMGPILADSATVGGNGGSIVPNAPPSGFPSTVVTQATWILQPGSWNQTQ